MPPLLKFSEDILSKLFNLLTLKEVTDAQTATTEFNKVAKTVPAGGEYSNFLAPNVFDKFKESCAAGETRLDFMAPDGGNENLMSAGCNALLGVLKAVFTTAYETRGKRYRMRDDPNDKEAPDWKVGPRRRVVGTGEPTIIV